jgi:hypothetical protein
MATNKPVFYRSATQILARSAELGVNDNQFVDGCNRGVANGAIGINTGDFDPKATDFARITHFAGPVSYIGKLEEAVANFEDNMWGITGAQLPVLETAVRVGFDVAAGDTAPDADYGTLPVTNYTGKTIPAGSWAWGFEAVGGDPVAPIVSAGGPYTTFPIEPNFNPVQLAGTLFPGTDPAPVLQWSIFVDGLGSFDDPAALDAIFTATAFTGATPFITLILVASPNDGPAVSSTATVEWPQ